MNESIRMRPAVSTDARAVADVLIDSRRAFLPYAPMAHPPDEVRTWVATVLIPGGGVTIAERIDAGSDARTSEVVGVLAVSDDGAIRWVDQLYLRPDAVGHGLGTRLLRHALTNLAAPVRLYTFQQNVGARRFYERNGFVAIAFGDGSGNEEGVPDVLFERR